MIGEYTERAPCPRSPNNEERLFKYVEERSAVYWWIRKTYGTLRNVRLYAREGDVRALSLERSYDDANARVKRLRKEIALRSV